MLKVHLFSGNLLTEVSEQCMKDCMTDEPSHTYCFRPMSVCMSFRHRSIVVAQIAGSPHLQHAISPTVSTRVISVSEIAMDHMHLQTSQQQVGYSRQKPIYLHDCWYGNYKQIYRRKPLTALPIEQCWFHIGMLHLLLQTSSLCVHLKVGVNSLTLSPVSHPSSTYGCT